MRRIEMSWKGLLLLDLLLAVWWLAIIAPIVYQLAPGHGEVRLWSLWGLALAVPWSAWSCFEHELFWFAEPEPPPPPPPPIEKPSPEAFRRWRAIPEKDRKRALNWVLSDDDRNYTKAKAAAREVLEEALIVEFEEDAPCPDAASSDSDSGRTYR